MIRKNVHNGMVKIFWIPVIVLLVLFSCTKKEQRDYTPPVTTTADTPATLITSNAKTYLALGDSYTIGQSVTVDQRFPVQTASLLIADSVKTISPEIIAQTGWTTTNLLNSIKLNPPSKTSYDIVSLLIGVNNQYQHVSTDVYKTEFTQLLNKSIVLAGNVKLHVFVLSIPDYSVTPFASGMDKAAIAYEIDAYNKINKDITLATGCNYIDITPASRLASNDPSLIASDGLHPSGKQYMLWAMALEPVVKAALR